MNRFGGLPALLALVWSGAALPSCTGGAARRECLSLLEKKDYPATISRCGELYERTRDPSAGLAVARAKHATGDLAGALEWEERLEGTGEEAALLALAADIHRTRRDTEARRRALQRLAAVHDRQRTAGGAADAYQQLGVMAWQGSDYRSALEYAALALERAERAQDRKRKAAAFRGLFIAYYEIGDLRSALTALREEEKQFDPGDRESRARHSANEAGLRLDEGRPELARQAAERALELGSALKDGRFFRTAHVNLVMAHLTLGRLDEAERHLQEAGRHADPRSGEPVSLLYARARLLVERRRYQAALAALDAALEKKPAPEWEWDLHYWRGVALEALRKPRLAMAAHEDAATVIERMRGSLGLDDLKAWILDRNRRPYEALFRLHALANEPRAALLAFERATSRSFLDAFVAAAASADAVPPGGGSVLPDLQRIRALEEYLPRLTASPTVEIRPADALLRALGDRHVLAYFRSEEQLWLMAVAGGRIRIRALPGPARATEDLALEFVRDVRNEEVGRRLAGVLLPEDSLPPPGATVYIVTEGVLDAVPFAALRHRGRYLVENYVLSLVSSLNALAAVAERPGDPGSPPVVVADSRTDLPRAAAESREVARALGVHAFTGAAATTAAVRSAKEARVLHLAVHTGVSHRGPWIAAHDGMIGSDAILGERLRPRLVVLATCVSAGSPTRGLGGSLAATFLASGTRSLVATLRSVEDETAHDVITRFYAQGGAAHPAGALTRAMRSLIGEGRDPSQWAPFVHVGMAEPF